MLQALRERLSGMSLTDFAHMFVNETTAITEFYKLCANRSAGKHISLLFNPHRLDTDTKISPISIYKSLSYKSTGRGADPIDGLARLYLYNLEHDVQDPFFQAIQRGYNGIAYVNEFPPYVARQVYMQYAKSKDGERTYVLDPCCGWGGRMIGCASIPNTTYIGCDPSTKTYQGLVELGNWLKTLQPTFDFQVYNIPYEEFQTEQKFDIALTSPPYFDTEHYSTEQTNSLNRYESGYDTWVKGFYEPLIKNTMSRLKDDGVFVLNVGDRKYPLSNSMKEICDNNDIYYNRIHDYLAGNGEDKEKFWLLTRDKSCCSDTLSTVELF